MGARDRVEVERKRAAYGAWLGGLLGGMRDPKTYPALPEILGEDTDEPPADEPTPEAAHVGAKLWCMLLNS